jgi:glutathione S-transferase
VRIHALELGVSLELVDVFTDAGQAALRAFNPLWKVPALDAGQMKLFDSADIVDHLQREFSGKNAPPKAAPDGDTRNLKRVIDGALDALINAFYLKKDGVMPETAPYVAKQHQRAASALKWLDAALPEAWLVGDEPPNSVEVDLITALDWIDFRAAHGTSGYPRLLACRARHAARESIRKTAPSA